MVIGAPKCGTTDMCRKIVYHPQIVGAVEKEPYWYNRRRLGIHFTKIFLNSPFKDFQINHQIKAFLGVVELYYFFSTITFVPDGYGLSSYTKVFSPLANHYDRTHKIIGKMYMKT